MIRDRLRVSDRFGQHEAQLILCHRWLPRSRRFPLCHADSYGMPERKLKPRNPRKLGREPSSERKPTVKHFADDRGHAVALPTYALPTDLLLRTSTTSCGGLRQTGTTGKSVKTCLALCAKIFRFRSHPNQSHNSACLTADEGRSRSSRTRGEMRWTRWRARRTRRTRTAKSCGSGAAVLALSLR